jgi:AmmeMemoRadiSam system protein B/AmmeMemoRadiSam system protein A
VLVMERKHGLSPFCAALLMCVALELPALAADRVRPSALAGTWYPADPQELGEYVDKLLDAVKPEKPAMQVRALIVPHAGYPFSGATAAQVFARVRGRDYKRVILLAPSHHSGFRGLSIADVDAYQTPLGDVSLDGPAVAELRKSDLVNSDPTAHVPEHSIEIELPFLQRTLKPGWRLLPVLVGQMEREDYKKAADLLRPLADEETLVVVSSDFTHFGPRFGYMPFPVNAETPRKIRALDDGAIEYIVARDASGLLDYQERTGITICGYRPLALLLTLLPPDVGIQPIAYATSGELTGDWGSSVSYVGMLATGTTPISGDLPDKKEAGAEIDKADLLALHRLAALGVQTAVLGPSGARGADIRKTVEGLPERLKEPSGAFVTLKEDGQLRGCIGYILPRKPLYEAVLENGFNAARNDRRFTPVRTEELGNLEVEVSVLSEPRPIDSYDQFQVGEQGVILSKDGHQAVFLPEVAPEQGWTREDTLSHLAQKAGLAPDAWRDGASFEVFTSDKYAAPYPTPAKDLGPLAGMQRAPTHKLGSTNRK